MRNHIKLEATQGVGLSQTATQKIPKGPTYTRLVFEIKDGAVLATAAAIKAAISEIRFNVNGKTQRRHSADDMSVIYGYRGLTAEDGYLTLWFVEPWRRTVEGEIVTALGTADIDTCTVEIDFAASGIINPVVSCVAEVLAGVTAQMGNIVKYRKFNFDTSVAGIYDVTSLPRGVDYRALHIKNADISAVEVVTNTTRQHISGGIPSSTIDKMVKDYGWQLQAGWQHVPFDLSGFKDDRLMTGTPSNPFNDFQLRLTVDNPGSVEIIAEIIGPRD